MIFSPAASSPAVRATAGLGITQIIGWGTTFLMPSVLGRHMERDLALPSEVIYGGIATGVVVAGLIIIPEHFRLRRQLRELRQRGGATRYVAA